MDDVTRSQLRAELFELRAVLRDHEARPEAGDAQLRAHVDELEALLAHETFDAESARGSLAKLEARALALEAEHPKLTSLVTRLGRLLENVGL